MKPEPDFPQALAIRAVAVVQLVDPVTRLLVANARVRLLDANGADTGLLPVLNASGRFVFRGDDSAALVNATLQVDLRQPHLRLPPVLPPSTPWPPPAIPDAVAGMRVRLFTVTLEAQASYPVPEGVTAVRGRVTAADGTTGVAGVLLGFQYTLLPGKPGAPGPLDAAVSTHTDPAGGFVLPFWPQQNGAANALTGIFDPVAAIQDPNDPTGTLYALTLQAHHPDLPQAGISWPVTVAPGYLQDVLPVPDAKGLPRNPLSLNW